MKTKSIWKGMAALMCMVVMAVGLASCSEEENEFNVIKYTYNPNLSISGSDMDVANVILVVMNDYGTALTQAMGGDYCTTVKDEEVISACDKVYQNHLSKYPNLKGTITILRNSIDPDSSSSDYIETAIKTYTYGQSK